MAAGKPAPSEVAEVYQRFFARQSRLGRFISRKGAKPAKIPTSSPARPMPSEVFGRRAAGNPVFPKFLHKAD